MLPAAAAPSPPRSGPSPDIEVVAQAGDGRDPLERRSTTGSSHPANSGGPEQLASRPSSGQGRPFGPTPRGSTALRLRRPQRRRPRARRPRRENPERVAARRGRQTRPPPHYRLDHGQNDPPRQRPPVQPVPAGSTLWNGAPQVRPPPPSLPPPPTVRRHAPAREESVPRTAPCPLRARWWRTHGLPPVGKTVRPGAT